MLNASRKWYGRLPSHDRIGSEPSPSLILAREIQGDRLGQGNEESRRRHAIEESHGDYSHAVCVVFNQTFLI